MINLESQYPGKIDPSSSDYPYGEPRNISTPGDGTGTPWEEAWVKDMAGMQQAVLVAANVIPSGNPDTAQTSQFLESLQKISTGSVDFVNDLIGVTGKSGMQILATGRTALSDGGGGLFYWSTTVDKSTADGGIIIDPDKTLALQGTGVGTGGWIRIFSGAINVKWFGATGDGATDDTASFLKVVSVLTSFISVYVPGGTFLVEDPITVLFNGISFYGDGVDTTVIKRTTDGGDIFTVARSTPATTQLAGFTLRDITLHTEFDATTGAALHILNATRVNLGNVFIRNGHIGMHLEGIRDSRFDGLEMIMGEHYTTDRVTAAHLLFDNPADASKISTETFFSNFNFTTAGNPGDVHTSLSIKGSLDGIWFDSGHMFGGLTAACTIDGAGTTKLQGLTFDNVWFDQFNQRNLIIQGSASVNFRLLTFNDCRFWGGETNNISTDTASNIQDVTFNSCEIGVTLGNGLQVGAGQITAKNCDFKQLNQSLSGASYAAQIASGSAIGTTLTIKGSIFDMTNLHYGIQCVDTAKEYVLTGNDFKGDFGSTLAEILFTGSALVGTAANNTTLNTAAGDVVSAAGTITNSNIVTDRWDITGAANNIDTLEPKWHGRRLTLKADTNPQSMVTGGTIRNKLDAASVTIGTSDMAMYEYRSDTNRWHAL